jgi:hypothetical protein
MPVSINGTTGYAGPLGVITVDTASIQANAVTTAKIADTNVTLAKLARVGSSGQVLTSNGTGADPSYQALPAGGVTSVSGGSGISVSAATGAVTISDAAPSFNAIGSYAILNFSTNQGTKNPGDTIGSGIRCAQIFWDSCSNFYSISGIYSSASGTWRYLGCSTPGGGNLCVRVS